MHSLNAILKLHRFLELHGGTLPQFDSISEYFEAERKELNGLEKKVEKQAKKSKKKEAREKRRKEKQERKLAKKNKKFGYPPNSPGWTVTSESSEVSSSSSEDPVALGPLGQLFQALIVANTW